MIKKHSDDPNVELAAQTAHEMISHVLSGLPKAKGYDYGGHILKLGEYEVCSTCTIPIAEAQQANRQILELANKTEDALIKEHLELAAYLFKLEAETSVVRAELHNGIGTEKILNSVLEFIHKREIHDKFEHSHNGGN